MPYVNKPRPYKHEYQLQLKRPEYKKAQAEREKARNMYDKLGIDRKGKDIDHKKPIANGGTTSRGNLRLRSPHANRSYARNSDHTPKGR